MKSHKRQNHSSKTKFALFAGTAALTTLAVQARADGTSAVAVTGTPAAASASKFQKPAWLTDLGVTAKETYDDNIFNVSGSGMTPDSSWITTFSPKVGFNFAPLLGDQKVLQTLSLVYAPDFVIFHNEPSESYNAHRINNAIKGRIGDFSFALDNAFLYNDGNPVAPIYALNQTANQLDKYRNNFAHGPVRERRKQIQDRSNVTLQYDLNNFFVRPTASWVDYDLMTDMHNTGAAPWKGYQNYISRYDLNGGVDLGYKLTSDVSVLLGYRYGHQYQQQLAATIDSDRHHADSDYQRVLLGLEGKPLKWLTVKLSGGPDFRYYNPMAPVNDRSLVTYYGEASLTANITADHSVTFAYKGWQWVSSTGKAPEFDSSYSLNYHWNATKQLGFDLGGKFQEADFTRGNDLAGSAPSWRDDGFCSVTAGVSYAFTPHLNTSLTYAYNMGRDLLDNYHQVPTLAKTSSYREFNDQQVSLAVQYKF